MDFREKRYDVFHMFDKQWALLTAGRPEKYNTMTISWGSLGTLWGPAGQGKPIATVYVKPARFTHQFLEEGEFFTISFFPSEFRKDLALLGTKSGRDGDKVAETSLTPRALGQAVAFEEAERIFVCRKIYAQDFDRARIPDAVVEQYYRCEAPHTCYIGEIIDVLSKERDTERV
ncbi:MAG: hypothetical protein SOR89_02845 [Ndongobacter sp.]|nr:hypothetical protein [Ndongobacter sp.]